MAPLSILKVSQKNFFFTLDSDPKIPFWEKYPKSAFESGVDGYVVVPFVVSAWCPLQDPAVVSTEPSGFFESAALEAANKMQFGTTRFKPYDRVLHKFTFLLDSNTRFLVVAEYPGDAIEQKQHGHVIGEFETNENGMIETL